MLVRLKEIYLAFGLKPLLDHVDTVIPEGQRIALVGRNGEGKSSFLKLLANQLQADAGKIEFKSGTRVSYLLQSVPNIQDSVSSIIAKPLEEQCESWEIAARVEKTLDFFQLAGDKAFNDLSGGLKRRVLLAQAWITEPNLLLLDEPTNHLDIQAIDFLEQILLTYQGTLLFVSHDRQFTRHLATQVFDLDRGKLTTWQCGYDDYVQRKQDYLQAEEKEQARFDKKLQQEEVWIRQGIKARRTRNEGRVRALEAMRRQRANRRAKIGTVNLNLTSAQNSGQSVINAENITYAYSSSPIIQAFSIDIMRGDKIGIIGSNGCGKTTLIKILLKELPTQTGKVKLGTNLDILYFDQLRQQIDDEQSVLDNVAQGQSHVEFAGKTTHIMGYLQQFLFAPERALSPAGSLSGGERNRLLLAKLFTKPANFLVLDEPSNDLDVETLELLEALLVNFNGTILLVSHDRELINNVVTSTLVFENNGHIQEYVGGYDDYLRQTQAKSTVKATEKKLGLAAPVKINKSKLEYEEQKELGKIPDKISKLEKDIQQLQVDLADNSLYENANKPRLDQLTALLQTKEHQLNQLYDRWEILENKK
ncbi:MAG: ATP-binding cassette domain-containing protein [Legionellales bacterium]|nr:ATP-binding cassette domain-containing protein [Legionellales bacterium]